MKTQLFGFRRLSAEPDCLCVHPSSESHGVDHATAVRVA
jgi:hypothetical protein